MSQPNFTELFYSSLRNAKRPLCYQLRSPPMLLHDLVFMSSLLHDARLLAAKTTRVGCDVEMHLDRDRWELKPLGEGKTEGIVSTPAILRIVGVHDLAWHPESSDANPWIDYLWVSEDVRRDDANTFEFALVGTDWRLVLTLDSENWAVLLTDQN